MTLAWWIGVPAAHATLTCGEATHRLIWENGTLTAADHADPDGERALTALGGEPLACIAMLDAWRRHAEDPDVLLLGSRGPGDLIAAADQRSRQIAPRTLAATLARSRGYAVGSTGIRQSLRPMPASQPGDDDELFRLLSIGGGLGRRLDATVAAHWHARFQHPDAETDRLRARSQAALYGRVLATLAAWLGESELALTLEPRSDAEPPLLRRAADGTIVAALPFGWLVEVWARGLELIWGRFCLSATTANGRDWELLTVGPELDLPATLMVTLPG